MHCRPGDVQGALKMIGEKVKRLRVMDIQFQDKQPELSERLQNVMEEATVKDAVEANFEVLDFDNVMTDGSNPGEGMDDDGTNVRATQGIDQEA